MRLRMRFTRVMGELALAGGAIAGILFVVNPQIPAMSAQRVLTPAAHRLAESDAALAEDGLDLDKLVGIAQFVKGPARYRFAYGGDVGEVTGARLEGDRLIVDYVYADDASLDGTESKAGTLTGTVNSAGKFSGIYRTQLKADGKERILEGEIGFTFAADGTAKGHDDNGQKTVRILREDSVVNVSK